MKKRHQQAIRHQKKHYLSDSMRERLYEGFLLIVMTLFILLWLSILTYHPDDPGWSSTGVNLIVKNFGGRVGAYCADFMLSFFGIIAYFIPIFCLIILSIRLKRQHRFDPFKKDWVFELFGILLIIMSTTALAHFFTYPSLPLLAKGGGILGKMATHLLTPWFNTEASIFIFSAILFGGVTLSTGYSWLIFADHVGQSVTHLVMGLKNILILLFNQWTTISNKRTHIPATLPEPKRLIAPIPPKTIDLKPISSTKETQSQTVVASELVKKAKIREINTTFTRGLPSSALLNLPMKTMAEPRSSLSCESLSQLVEKRLLDFGVMAEVVGVYPGPIITRFEVALGIGVKVSKITGLAKDIARSLSTVSVRIVEVIPGKSVIGIELPNEYREQVSLREIIESERYLNSRSPLTLVLGKDTAGDPMTVDLAKMPHLLVAGTTGSGKSVSLNVMLLSMLFKSTPADLRLIMIDPKMLELSVYDGIPHLLTPVITDMKDAANALRWCVAEMDRRYRFMAALGVRHLDGYNQKVMEAQKRGEPLMTKTILGAQSDGLDTQLEPLPLIVVVVDEFADMMMVVGKKVEDLIARLAQKARASGIHLILATQRPSVDVITGLIKANIPTRIAFQVSSRIDSRTILDQQGAEQLLGNGDMLYLPPGVGVPVRVHGAYVTDEEVHRVADAWRSMEKPVYISHLTDDCQEEENEGGQAGGEQDSLYDEAAALVIETQRASISMVQRKFRIGYNRAARMMDEMEKAGIVSAMDQNGFREVLVPSGTIS